MFEVIFKAKEIPVAEFVEKTELWQFRCRTQILPDKIVGFHHITKDTIIDREELREMITKNNDEYDLEQDKLVVKS